MGIEALKKQLAEGTITKEQFIAELKKLLDAGTIDQAAHDAEVAEANKTNDPPGNGFTDEQLAAIQKMMQSEADKVRTKAANDKKLLEDQLEKLKTEKMTEQQKADYERKKLEDDLKAREATLNSRVVELHTIDKLTEAKLPLVFKEFLVSESTEDADKKIASFTSVWQAAIKAEVDAVFKQNGGNPPGKGGAAGTTVNPWKAETFNLTKQAKILKDDPELAKQLMAQAGK